MESVHTKKEDLRIVKTKKNIEDTFLRLLESKSFKEISVKNIVEEAMISKGTFYSHYLDKYDLAEKISAKYLHELESSFIAALSETHDYHTAYLWWNRIQSEIPEMLHKWSLLRLISLDNGTVEEQFQKILKESFYTFLQKEGIPHENLERYALLSSMITIGYFKLYELEENQISPMGYLNELRSIIDLNLKK